MSDSLSLNGVKWLLPDYDLSIIEAYKRQTDLSDSVIRMLLDRDVSDQDSAVFLDAKIKDYMPDPFVMAGMEAMVSDLSQAIRDKKSIAILGDFDVDGATSSAVFYHFLKHCGIEAEIYIPQRLTEGYGPNKKALQALADNGNEIVLMLDCGTAAHDEVQFARDIGLDVYIFDHHLADRLPNANHIINPQREDDESGLTMLAAVGVVFMACVALNRALEAGAPLMAYSDLVALGTVADIMPLIGINRALVRTGLKQMENTAHAGLQALIQIGRAEAPFTPYHCGFVLGPRINAGSRVGDSTYGAKLLTASHDADIQDYVSSLDHWNTTRKEKEAALVEEVFASLEGQEPEVMIFHCAENSTTGINGLIAGKLSKAHNVPAFVASPEYDADGNIIMWCGSGRSIAGIDIGAALQEAANNGLLMKGGGHSMAGGFSVDESKVDAFEAFIRGALKVQFEDYEPILEERCDGLLTVRGASATFLRSVEAIGPFGQGNREPRFLLRDVKLFGARRTNGGVGAHIQVKVSDRDGGGAALSAIAFNVAETALGDALMNSNSEHRGFNLVAALEFDYWNRPKDNPAVKLRILDGWYDC